MQLGCTAVWLLCLCAPDLLRDSSVMDSAAFVDSAGSACVSRPQLAPTGSHGAVNDWVTCLKHSHATGARSPQQHAPC
jgi:hypothetical protein